MLYHSLHPRTQFRAAFRTKFQGGVLRSKTKVLPTKTYPQIWQHWVGGWTSSGYSDLVEIYNVDNDDWEFHFAWSFPQAFAWATSVPFRGTFLIVGGFESAVAAFDTVYEFDAENRGWIEREEKLSEGLFLMAAMIVDANTFTCPIVTTGVPATTGDPNSGANYFISPLSFS
jgi:hypothetical protein